MSIGRGRVRGPRRSERRRQDHVAQGAGRAGPGVWDGRIDGQAASGLKPRDRARHLAYLPQGHSFSWPLPAGEIVALGRYPHADPFSPVSDKDREAVAHALDMTGTRAFADRIVTTLSGGERARVALARVLATRCEGPAR